MGLAMSLCRSIVATVGWGGVLAGLHIHGGLDTLDLGRVTEHI